MPLPYPSGCGTPLLAKMRPQCALIWVVSGVDRVAQIETQLYGSRDAVSWPGEMNRAIRIVQCSGFVDQSTV
jgi:hypothetical protein